MADAILFTVTQSLLTNLGSGALNEVASTWGIKSHVEELKNTIIRIQAVMLDAEERQVESLTVRGLLERLRSVMFDADDLFDECTTMALQRTVMGSNIAFAKSISSKIKKVHNFFSRSNEIAFAKSISSKIKKIREELDDIVKDISRFAFVLRPHEESEERRLIRQVRGQTHSFIAGDDVIGREDDREAIIDIMMPSHAAQEQRLAVIPIVGIGGLGKTTLAQLLYNDERVENNFELKLWVCVTEVFDVKEITMKIIMSATSSMSQFLTMEQLQGQLWKEIGGKKYLLVLDDVWNEDRVKWLHLKALLMVGGEGSQILVTTRSRKVANIMGSVQAYELNGLSEEKAWKLFEKMAFNPGESQKQPQLVKLAKEISKRCVGVPLAITSLGTLLKGEEEWKWISIAGSSSVNLPDDIVKDSSDFAFVLRPHEENEERRLSRQVGDPTDYFIAVHEVIGREDDREAIIDIMMASHAAQEQRLAVISIVGIGGLGKTTLARLLYNDERVENNFELKLWVCVSEVFDVKEITKKIIMSATNSMSQNLEMDQLQGQLRKEIGGKKYLLVLDDVWNEKPEEWLNLKALLMVGGEGSQILVTTRSRKVANIMGSVQAYELNGLSEEKAWKLFEKMAFNPGESQKKPQLVKLAEEILKRCVGVPLAIRSLGTLLRGEEEWKWISIAGTSFVNLPDKQNNVMAILKLSYNHLLSPLKNCFAYCALFPKDYKFEAEMLIDLWMAEGFVVPSSKTQCLEDLCHEYLMQLLQRCFFQDVTRDKWGSISSFKMHDLMHDLAIEVAGIESRSTVADFQDGDINAKTRHLSFDHYYQTGSWKIPSYMLEAKQLRTFLLPEYNRSGSYFNEAILQQLISNFRCLRVLDMRDRGVKCLPKSIGNLIHLRYLNLSLNPIEELPHSVTRLYNLQTLILYGCQWLRALPIHTRKLTNLRNLNTLDCKSMTHMPSGLGELTSLHKLPIFIVKRRDSNTLKSDATTAQLRDLKTLSNLSGSLEIHFFKRLKDPASEAREADLHSKHRLTELVLRFEDFSGNKDHDKAILEGLKPHQNLKKLDIYSYKGRNLPSWAMRDSFFKTLPNLIEVHLSHFNNCQEVPSFSLLPFLKRLSVSHFEEVEYMERNLLGIDLSQSPPQTFFPSLEELSLSGMSKLKGWWEDMETIDYSDNANISHQSSQHHPLPLSFSKLTKLEIKSCWELKTFPLCPIVEELTLWSVNKHLTLLSEVTSSQASGDVGSSVTTSEYCSKLKTLSVDKAEHLFSLPRECLVHITSLAITDIELLNTCVLKDVFQSLPSLTSLTFLCCFHLKSIFEGLEHLTSLESLVLKYCDELDLSQNRQVDCDMPWEALRSIRLLDIVYIPKLHHLPNGFQHLTKLRSLKLQHNRNLEALPEWISCFSSLEYMCLIDCPELKCLPEGFSKLTTLYELLIEDCPGLTYRCAGPTGADFQKIQDIRILSVKEKSEMIYRVCRV